MYPDAGSVLELHAFRTAHHVGRAEGMQLTCGDQERVHGAHRSPAADARLGACSLLTSYSVRGGRVCSLKRVGPSKVMSEVSLGGLGLTPRPPPSIGLMASADDLRHGRGKQRVARSRSSQALSHREQAHMIG